MLYYPTFYMFRGMSITPREKVCGEQKHLSAPAMLLPHESTVSHETQQEKGVLTARQLTAAQDMTNGGSKVKTQQWKYFIGISSLVSKLYDKDHNARSCQSACIGLLPCDADYSPLQSLSIWCVSFSCGTNC